MYLMVDASLVLLTVKNAQLLQFIVLLVTQGILSSLIILVNMFVLLVNSLMEEYVKIAIKLVRHAILHQFLVQAAVILHIL